MQFSIAHARYSKVLELIAILLSSCFGCSSYMDLSFLLFVYLFKLVFFFFFKTMSSSSNNTSSRCNSRVYYSTRRI